ncbi:MAG: methylmalonyl-CoA mutase [Candidatus Lokiarchaeota archaeon]|jgi:methylmalonyl-CoA mutase N-terminal domain/subunit|nr:methylmalonyl-CoA mutase [Candidatus Lokiarchaeota archaeon]
MYDDEYLENIRREKEKWEKKYKDVGERDTKFETDSGIPVKRLYTPLDVKGDYLEEVGFPGQPPYTRGPYPTMYRGRIWTMRLFSGHGTPEETNERWKFLYTHGETGFSAAVDALTFNGIDPSNADGAPEVGTSGVPLYCIDSLFALTEDIPIDKISVALVVEPFTAAPVCSMYFNMAKKRGYDIRNLMGTTQNDILTMTVGYIPYKNVPPDHLLRLACDFIEWTVPMGNVPKWHPINFTGYNYREGGIDAVQELGFVFASACSHIDEIVDRGWKADDFVNRLAFHLSAHKDFFEEIAKYRAARRIWAKLMKNRYEVEDPKSMQFRFHVQTAGSSLTAQLPKVNIIRTAIQALEATLGGCQSLHTNSFDEAICLPSKEAALIALRTQQVISDETRITNTVDPLAGSYYVEWLTDEIEEKVWNYMDKIEKVGSIDKALSTGWLYKEMRDAFHKRQKKMETGEEITLGVNKYPVPYDEVTDVFRTNDEAMKIEKERVERLKKRRDNDKLEEILDKLRTVCEKEENVMPVVMEATKEGATVGEVCDIYREIWGIWEPPLAI